MWKAHCEEIHLGEQATHRTNVCYARSPSKGGPDGGPYGVAEKCSRARDRGRSCWPLSGSPYRLHPRRNQAPRGTKPFHATKDCSGAKGVAGDFCTIRSSNVKALTVGSKIFYLQAGGKTALNSDTAIYAGPGNIAAGHCLLRFATGVGLCTISDGTGTLAGFHARVRVTADSSIPDAVALGRDLQLQSGLDPVGNRPVSERVARWLSSLSAKYIAVFALLVAVPVICTSVYLLNSSYQDNKRALTRLQQEKAKSVSVTIDQYFKDLIARMRSVQGQYLSFTALGAALAPLLDDRRHGCVLHRRRRTQDARDGGRRALPPPGKLLPSAERGAGEGDRGLLRPSVRSADSCPTLEHESMEVVVRARIQGGATGQPQEVDSSARRWI